MRYDLAVDIDLPRERVVALFDDPENLKRWQPGLVSHEPLEGPPGEEGSTARLRYEMGNREIDMVETVTQRDLPEVFAGTYEAKGVHNQVTNRFEELDGDRTRWHLETEFTFTTLPMKVMGTLMPGAFKKQSRQFMEQFKTFAEGRGELG